MKKLDGSPKTLKELLLNTKYTIHYYQREYMWGKKQIEELINDLTSEFLNHYERGHERVQIYEYGAYFMGSVVLVDGIESAIIDGQQRLTSLTLLLIYLRNRLAENSHFNSTIDGMIYSEAVGRKSFNIYVERDEEREKCLTSIFKKQDYEYFGKNESIKNIWNRYKEIEEIFPEEIDDEAIIYFADWLCERVFFIRIVATTEQDAHKVFVSMNDRGLSLTPTEMLKGYLLSEITNDSLRELYNDKWKLKISNLKSLDKAEEGIFIRDWLRSQYAQTIRETKKGAEKEDYDIIGSGFHKWVRDERSKLGLNRSEDYEELIDRFEKYADIYIRIKKYELTYNENFKHIYYNAKLNFTFQAQLLLASICYNDTDEIVNKKLNMVSRYIDMFIYARAVNYKSNNYSTIKNYIFGLTKKIRNLNTSELEAVLKDSYNNLGYSIENRISFFMCNQYTKIYIKHMLARITGFIEERSGFASNYLNYVNQDQRYPYEVEHITPDHYEWYQNEYSTEAEFNNYRNNIGDLLLLPKHINASLNDQMYDYKIKKYCSNEGNLYAASLADITYLNNPQFKRFIEEYKLNMKPYSILGKSEILERATLVKQLTSLIWNIDKLAE